MANRAPQGIQENQTAGRPVVGRPPVDPGEREAWVDRFVDAVLGPDDGEGGEG